MISHDPLFTLIDKETRRQREGVQLIPSENFASENVRKAVGSPLMNKYSEGYPHRRYYEGNDIIDEIEDLAIKRACALFSHTVGVLPIVRYCLDY